MEDKYFLEVTQNRFFDWVKKENRFETEDELADALGLKKATIANYRYGNKKIGCTILFRCVLLLGMKAEKVAVRSGLDEWLRKGK